MGIKKQILLALGILLLTILLFGLTNIDGYIQDMLYDFHSNTWILDKNLQPWKFIFYDGLKRLLISIAVILLLVLVLFRKNKTIKLYKKGLLLIVLSSIFIPFIIIGLKNNTNMPCPKNEISYGGQMPRTAVWEKYEKPYKSMKHISCWPAGHASGGFVLLSFFFLFSTKRNKMLALFIALGVGWSMGIYKMLIGDHYLSHTIITMILSWICILGIHTLIFKEQD